MEKKFGVAVLVIGIVSVFSILFLSLLIFGFIESLNKSTETDHQLYVYQYLERNTESKSTKVGRISLQQQIDKYDFISYRDNDGNNFLISNFGDSEYECTGTCYCSSIERRASIPVISRTISYLLVSISSFVAFERARIYFENECKKELSSECHHNSIFSDLDGCLDILEKEEGAEKKQQSPEEYLLENEDESDKPLPNEPEKRRGYYCYGNCVENKALKRVGTRDIIKNLELEPMVCGDFREEGEVYAFVHEINIENRAPLSLKFQDAGKKRFQLDYLLDFCHDHSVIEYNFKGEKVTTSRCVGVMSGQRHIRCLQIEPQSKAFNANLVMENWWREKESWDYGEVTLPFTKKRQKADWKFHL